MTNPQDDHSSYRWLMPLLLRRPDLAERMLRARRWLAALPRPWRTKLLWRLGLSVSSATLMLLLASSVLSPAARAETDAPDYTITVANGMVAVAPDKKCSLIEAIVNANDTKNGRPHTDCAAGNPRGADTIVLPKDGMFTLTAVHNSGDKGKNGLPWITSAVSIDGNNSTIRRAASAPAFRLLAVGKKGTLNIDSVTLTGGKVDWLVEPGWLIDAAAIFTEGALSIRDCMITGNDGTAVRMYLPLDALTDRLTIERTTIQDNRGSGVVADGFYSYYDEYPYYQCVGPFVTVTQSRIGNNLRGGLIVDCSGTMVSESTISGNRSVGISASNSGLVIQRSIIDRNEGSGLSFGDVVFDVHESTISQNGDTGVWTSESVGNITGSTIVLNSGEYWGGGIYCGWDTSIDLYGSIVAGNTSRDGRNGQEISYNWCGINDRDSLFGHSGLTTEQAIPYSSLNLSGSSIIATSDGNRPTPLNQIIDTTLRDNGGSTLTHALVSGSPAIDAFTSDYHCTAPFDQRGAPFRRIVNGQCDMGAYERQSGGAADTSFFVTTIGNGTVSGLRFERRDILEWNGSSWSLFFDGSDRGLPTKADFSAFFVATTDPVSLVGSFAANTTLPFAGTVAPQDLALFDSGLWSLRFDGSDVGLTTAAEAIDAVHILPGEVSPIGSSCRRYILLSTKGSGSVPAAAGGTLAFKGEDVLGFCATGLGNDTAGIWHMVLDGSVEGMRPNATFSLSASDDARTLYLTTKVAFAADGVKGNQSMVFKFDRASGRFSGPVWKAVDHGLKAKMDGLDIRGTMP